MCEFTIRTTYLFLQELMYCFSCLFQVGTLAIHRQKVGKLALLDCFLLIDALVLQNVGICVVKVCETKTVVNFIVWCS